MARRENKKQTEELQAYRASYQYADIAQLEVRPALNRKGGSSTLSIGAMGGEA